MHRFEEMLVSEVGLEKIHARVFLHITTNGKSTVAKVASDLGIPENDALQAIVSLGFFQRVHQDSFCISTAVFTLSFTRKLQWSLSFIL